MARPRRDGKESRRRDRRVLTDLMVRKVKPEAQTFQVYDDKLRGLVLQVQPTGRKAWKVYYSRHGRPRWFHVGPADAIGLAEARTIAADIVSRVSRGEDPHADRLARRSEGTFGEIADAYLAECRNKALAQYEKQLRVPMKLWRTRPAFSITRSDVQRLFDGRKRTAPGSAKLLLASIAAVFSWEIGKGGSRIDINPAHGVASTKRDPTLRYVARERVLSDDEVRSFWTAWEESGLARCNALRVILMTGQRPGEVSHMRWEDVKEGDHVFERPVGDRIMKSTHAGAWWNLPGKRDGQWPGTKNGHAHRVWLRPAVLALLDEASGHVREGLVFQTSRGNPVSDLSRAMRDACRALGVGDPATPHDLRRTHGTMITRFNFGREAMNRIQNHREGGIGSVYDHNKYGDEARAIQERVGAMIAYLVSGEEDPRIADLDQERARRGGAAL